MFTEADSGAACQLEEDVEVAPQCKLQIFKRFSTVVPHVFIVNDGEFSTRSNCKYAQ